MLLTFPAPCQPPQPQSRGTAGKLKCFSLHSHEESTISQGVAICWGQGLRLISNYPLSSLLSQQHGALWRAGEVWLIKAECLTAQLEQLEEKSPLKAGIKAVGSQSCLNSWLLELREQRLQDGSRADQSCKQNGVWGLGHWNCLPPAIQHPADFSSNFALLSLSFLSLLLKSWFDLRLEGLKLYNGIYKYWSISGGKSLHLT